MCVVKDKLIFILLLLIVMTGCASIDYDENGLYTNYNEVSNSTLIIHKELFSGYNLSSYMDKFINWDRNINLVISINDKNISEIGIQASFTYADWIFMDGILFFNESNTSRIEITGGETERDTSVDVNVLCHEIYTDILSNDEIQNLQELLTETEPIFCAFLGKSNTDKMEISQEVRNAMLIIIEKYESMNN